MDDDTICCYDLSISTMDNGQHCIQFNSFHPSPSTDDSTNLLLSFLQKSHRLGRKGTILLLLLLLPASSGMLALDVLVLEDTTQSVADNHDHHDGILLQI